MLTSFSLPQDLTCQTPIHVKTVKMEWTIPPTLITSRPACHAAAVPKVPGKEDPGMGVGHRDGNVADVDSGTSIPGQLIFELADGSQGASGSHWAGCRRTLPRSPHGPEVTEQGAWAAGRGSTPGTKA